MEVLARAVHRAARLGVGSPAGRLRLSSDRSANTVEQLHLARQRRPAAQLGAGGEVAGQRAAPVLRVDVEAEQQAAQVLQAALGPLGRGRAGGLGGQVDLDGRAGAGGVRAPRAVVGRAAPGAAAARRSRPGCPPRPGTRAPGRGTARAAPSPSSCSPAPGSARPPRPRRRPTTGVATTSAGAGERTTPPSSRLTRWVTPSTSTRWIGPWVAGDQPEALAVDHDLAAVRVEALDLDVGRVHVAAAADADAEPLRARSGPTLTR